MQGGRSLTLCVCCKILNTQDVDCAALILFSNFFFNSRKFSPYFHESQSSMYLSAVNNLPRLAHCPSHYADLVIFLTPSVFAPRTVITLKLIWLLIRRNPRLNLSDPKPYQVCLRTVKNHYCRLKWTEQQLACFAISVVLSFPSKYSLRCCLPRFAPIAVVYLSDYFLYSQPWIFRRWHHASNWDRAEARLQGRSPSSEAQHAEVARRCGSCSVRINILYWILQKRNIDWYFTDGWLILFSSESTRKLV